MLILSPSGLGLQRLSSAEKHWRWGCFSRGFENGRSGEELDRQVSKREIMLRGNRSLTWIHPIGVLRMTGRRDRQPVHGDVMAVVEVDVPERRVEQG